MAKYAIVEKNFVKNIIVINAEQVQEVSEALGKELVEADTLRLTIGDYRRNGVWTRNIDGEQVALTEQPTYAELREALALLTGGEIQS